MRQCKLIPCLDFERAGLGWGALGRSSETSGADTAVRVRGLALAMLLRIGDPPSAAKLVDAFGGWTDYEYLARTHAPEVEHFLVEQTRAGAPAAAEGLRAYHGIPFLPVGEDVDEEHEGEALLELVQGDTVAGVLAALDAAESPWLDPSLGLVDDVRVRSWLEKQRAGRRFRIPDILGALLLAGDRDARAELWSMVRCGRHRLLHDYFDERVFTLDWDFSTLPHWIEELDSNCCRVAGGLEGIFQEKLGMRWLYDRPWSGLGEPRSQRVKTELLWYGGTYVWSPLVDRFVAQPD